jgi:hypothetical protein
MNDRRRNWRICWLGLNLSKLSGREAGLYSLISAETLNASKCVDAFGQFWVMGNGRAGEYGSPGNEKCVSY